jgi:hypothetical protein
VINIEQKFWNSERQRFVHCLSSCERSIDLHHRSFPMFFIGYFGEARPSRLYRLLEVVSPVTGAEHTFGLMCPRRLREHVVGVFLCEFLGGPGWM